MKTNQGSMIVSLRAVDAFLTRNAAVLGSVINTGARQKLSATILQLSGHASDQTGSSLESQSSTQTKSSLRTALMRDHMAPIASIAKSELPNTPEVAPLRMPRGRPTNAKLAAAAEGMAKAAAAYTSVFVDNGMPADFIAQLNTAADALNTALAEHTDIRARRRTATTGVQATISSGRKLVNILDKYVKSALKSDPVLLAGWNSVKRADMTGQKTGGATTTTPAGTTTSTKPASGATTSTPVAATPVAAAPVVATPVVATPVVATPVVATPVVATPVAATPVVSTTPPTPEATSTTAAPSASAATGS